LSFSILNDSIQEFIVFTAKTVVERTANGFRQSVNLDDKIKGKTRIRCVYSSKRTVFF